MAPPRANTPSRHRPSQTVKAGPEPEADTKAEISAPRAKTPYQRHHNQVGDTKPEAEIENTETRASRALTSWHHRRRPSRPTEADAHAHAEAENQIEKPAQPTIPTRNPPAPRQWALYFANLVRSSFHPIIILLLFLSMALTAFYLPFLPIYSHHKTYSHISDLGLHNLQ